MLVLRNKIALRLGYKSWDDFQTEIKMAETGAEGESRHQRPHRRHSAEVRRGGRADCRK